MEKSVTKKEEELWEISVSLSRLVSMIRATAEVFDEFVNDGTMYHRDTSHMLAEILEKASDVETTLTLLISDDGEEGTKAA